MFAVLTILAMRLQAGQVAESTAIKSARQFIKDAKLVLPSGNPDLRRIDDMTTLRWGGYELTFYPGAVWPSTFDNVARSHQIDMGQHRTHRFRFSSAPPARAFASGFAGALHVPTGAIVDSFKFGTGQGEFEMTWIDLPPAVAGRRLRGLNKARANFDMQDGQLKSFMGGWSVRYAKPAVKLTASQAEAAALRLRPSYFRLGTFRTTAKPTKTQLVWEVPRLDATGQPSAFDWNGTARVAYRVSFGIDTISVDAETGKLLSVEIYK